MPKNNDGHYIVSIDIGSSKIVVLLANEKDGRLEFWLAPVLCIFLDALPLQKKS